MAWHGGEVHVATVALDWGNCRPTRCGYITYYEPDTSLITPASDCFTSAARIEYGILDGGDDGDGDGDEGLPPYAENKRSLTVVAAHPETKRNNEIITCCPHRISLLPCDPAVSDRPPLSIITHIML